MAYFVYILECVNGAYYTGYTTDIRRRYQQHLSGTDACKYTRSFPPKRIAACWQVGDDLSVALKIEHWIKRRTKQAKQQLIAKPSDLTALLPSLANIQVLSSLDL